MGGNRMNGWVGGMMAGFIDEWIGDRQIDRCMDG